MLGSRLREKFPNRIPIIFVCQDGITLERNRYLVNEDHTLGEIMCILRKHIEVKPYEALFALVNNTLVPTSATMRSIYTEHANPDDMLYIHITKENTFG